MTNQERVFEEVKVKGDCRGTFGYVCMRKMTAKCKGCGLSFLDHPALNPDLATEDGMVWLLKRLPEWDRFGEFYEFWFDDISPSDPGFRFIAQINPLKAIKAFLFWLTTDAKDGKAPALFNALCGFIGLEVEG